MGDFESVLKFKPPHLGRFGGANKMEGQERLKKYLFNNNLSFL
jgi:hypothetical protein